MVVVFVVLVNAKCTCSASTVGRRQSKRSSRVFHDGRAYKCKLGCALSSFLPPPTKNNLFGFRIPLYFYLGPESTGRELTESKRTDLGLKEKARVPSIAVEFGEYVLELG